MSEAMGLKDLSADERVKIATLLSADKKKDEISWMYSEPKVDHEAFLLGKEVRNVSQIEDFDKDYEESPAQRLARFDMEAKLREDPLTLMRQREMEKRVDLLKNTAKLNVQKDKEKKKKHKKKHRRRQSPINDHSSDSSSGDELLDAFIKIIKHSDEAESKARDDSSFPNQDMLEPSSSNKGTNIEPKISNPSSRSHIRHSTSANYNKSARPKLSKDELEARRNQMLSDAKNHEQDRFNRSNQHYDKKRREEEAERLSKANYGPSFLKNVKNSHVDKTTLEDSIHRKTSSRQRGEMHSNFLSR